MPVTVPALAVLFLTLTAAQADHLYFSFSGSTHTSTFGSSTYSSFSFGTAPRVVQPTRPAPTTVIVTQYPPRTITLGNGQAVTVFGNAPVLVQSGQAGCQPGCYCSRPSGVQYGPRHCHRPTTVAPGGWYQSQPQLERYPGFPYSHSWQRVPPVQSHGLYNWTPNRPANGWQSAWNPLAR